MTTAEVMRRAAAAADRATASFRAFNAASETVIREFEEKHGPRPEGEPFLEWAIEVERNTEHRPEGE